MRAPVALAFAAIARCCMQAEPTPRHAAMALGTLGSVAALFFVGAQAILLAHGPVPLPAALALLYGSPPILLACGIAAFPLAAAEAVAIAVAALVAMGWLMGLHAGLLPAGFAPAILWLTLLVAVVSAFAAVSQVRLLRAVYAQLARDPLTGCLRRESGEELLQLQLALALRRRSPLTVLFADIDHFKAVNDRFGHDAGDRVLAAAAEALRRCVRDSDAVLRWGGEEFVLVLPDARGSEALACIARLRALGPGRLPDGSAVTLSMGIAEYAGEGSTDVKALVETADQRMYAAKQAGRNRYATGTGAPETIFASR